MFGEQEKLFELGQKLVHHAAVLGAGIAGMDSGELNGDAVAVVHACAVGVFADGVDGVHIVLVVAFGIGGGHGGFAEHIKGITVAHFFALFAVGKGFFYGLPADKLFAHQAHAVVHAFADKGGAAFG